MTAPTSARPSQRATYLAAGLAVLVVAVIVAALMLRNTDDQASATPTPGAPSASPAGASPSTSASEAASAAPSPATSEPGPEQPPDELTHVATFPGASSSAMTAWPGGWIAVGSTPAGPSVWLSSDGVSWEPAAPAGLEGASVNHVVALPDGRLLALGFFDDGSLGGSAAAWISSDGRAWARDDVDIPGLLNAVDIGVGPLGLVMIGRAEVNADGRNEYAWYSANGIDWEMVWETAEDESPAAVGAGPEGFVFVGQQGYEQGGSIGLAYASADGREWIEAPTEGALQLGGMWGIVPVGGNWIASSLDVSDIHLHHSPNGLDWITDTTFPGAETRSGGIAQLAGDGQFAMLASILVPRTELPVMLYTATAGWQETDASATSGIAAASRDGATVLMVNTGPEAAPELQFWIAATPG